MHSSDNPTCFAMLLKPTKLVNVSWTARTKRESAELQFWRRTWQSWETASKLTSWWVVEGTLTNFCNWSFLGDARNFLCLRMDTVATPGIFRLVINALYGITVWFPFWFHCGTIEDNSAAWMRLSKILFHLVNWIYQHPFSSHVDALCFHS